MEYYLHIMVIVGIYTILAFGLNLVLGYTGLPMFGHAAFFCVGAYASALLALQAEVSPWLGLLAGAALAGALGMVVALPSLRLKGDYLALATFGFAVVVHAVAKNWTWLTRGSRGLPGIPTFSVFGYHLENRWAYLLLIAVMVLLAHFFMKRIVTSPFGRVLRGIREDEIAALAMGKRTGKYKVYVFIVAAAWAGAVGSVYAHYMSFISPSSFTVMESIVIILMVVFGGMGSLGGSFVGALVLIGLSELLRFIGMPSSVAGPLRQMIYGLVLVVLMIKRPQGLWGRFAWK